MKRDLGRGIDSFICIGIFHNTGQATRKEDERSFWKPHIEPLVVDIFDETDLEIFQSTAFPLHLSIIECIPTNQCKAIGTPKKRKKTNAIINIFAPGVNNWFWQRFLYLYIWFLHIFTYMYIHISIEYIYLFFFLKIYLYIV